MLIGYIRVSSETNDKQNTDLQLDALLAAVSLPLNYTSLNGIIHL